ncbi:MAG: hypothetical protein ACKVT0_06125 [Planctomycetaceae bacterium]
MSTWSSDQDANGNLPRGSKPGRSWLARFINFVLMQLLALAVFVGFPVLVTAVAPVSWVRFERHGENVSATARICLLFVIPYKTLTVDPVVGIGDRFVEGSHTRERRTGRDRVTKSEDQGYLVIHGNDQVAEVPVTPHNLDEVIERTEAFLNEPQSDELELFVVANWKFSVIMGGLTSLLTVLYVGTLIFGVALKGVHIIQWALGVPQGRRLFARYMKNSPQ